MITKYFSTMLVITLASVFLCFSFAHAATLEVGAGKNYATIQSAIDAARTDDMVLVYPGTYTEIINFVGKAITVKSANGPLGTIINGSADGSVVTFNNIEGSGSVLDGFTITNGGDGGIYCVYSSPTITNCTISGNMNGNTAARGGGIYCIMSSFPTITNCTISGNTAINGGGICCRDNSSPTITNCTISGNTAFYGGGIFCYYSSTPSVKNSILWGNTATWGGNEILLLEVDYITVTYSDVMGGWKGTGNINDDPKFVGSGDYHLTGGSPCINTGTAAGAPLHDIDGEMRPQGAYFDMGSDEFKDSDNDGILDYRDNCPAVYNPDQDDAYGNDGIGDACDYKYWKALYKECENKTTTTTVPPVSSSSSSTTTVETTSISPTTTTTIAVTTTIPASTTTVQPPNCVSVSPASGEQGQTLDVVITGANTNFSPTSVVTFSCISITVNSNTAITLTQVIANITIAPDASPATCDITVTTGSEVVTCAGAFTVTGSFLSQMDDIRAFFYSGWTSGSLKGIPPNDWPQINAFANFLNQARYFINQGNTAQACNQLQMAYVLVDGKLGPAADYITGQSAAELAAKIKALIDSMCAT